MKHLNRKVLAVCVCLVLWIASSSVMAARLFPPDVRLPGLNLPDYQLQATVSGGEVTLTWQEISAPAGKTLLGYHVYRAQTPDFPLIVANRVTEFALKRTSLTDRAAAGTYYYVVQAVYADQTTAGPSGAVTVEIGSTDPTVTTTTGSGIEPSPMTPESAVASSAKNAPLSTEPQDFLMDLRVDGIPGSLERPQWNGFGDIWVTSFTWGTKTSLSASYGGGMGAGKPSFSDLVITKPIDRASPKLALASAMGSHIRETVLTVYRKIQGINVPFYTVHLYDIIISSDTIVSSTEGLFEQVSFNYTKIECNYWDVKTDGTLGSKITATYDLKTMKAN